ncbi:MAG: hypothetical protein LLG04_02850 [Parachlamydia sp.]|nr:hypothetical protein [Parachlamydia sp.]
MFKRLLMLFFLFTGSLSAQLAVPPCYFQLASTFFPYPLVAQALSMHKVTQDRWGIIANDLQARSAAIPQLLIARANLMVPNPLQPYNSLTAGALMRAVLEEVFTQSLMANYFTDPYAIHVMFNYIRDQQAYRVRACVGEGPMVNQPVTE